MFLKYFYDDALAHASWLVGCQRTGEAIVIDPGRDVEPYLKAAAGEGLRVTAAAETHIHADFVSGARELADRTGARLYLSDEGPAAWKYQFADQHDTRLVKQGDLIRIGGVRLEVLHTPGHTPEHISFVLTDEGGGADAPMGIFTGDFVFAGSIGRPDLLETAAGVIGSAEQGARQLFHSVQRFRNLPDHLQIWPAHGSGSACGKGLGAVPSSTVGYEKRFNPALQFEDEQSFVDEILSDQPETPFYFAIMKRVNKVGPTLIRNLNPVLHPDLDQLPGLAQRELTIDTSPAQEFAVGHVPGTIHLPAKDLARWAGFLVNYEQPLNLIVDPTQLDSALRSLRSIGIDHVAMAFDASAVRGRGLCSESSRSESPQALQPCLASGKTRLLDVRSATEHREEWIPGSEHHFLGYLLRELPMLERSKPLAVHCLGGGRSAIAASILQRAGLDVVNMTGGIRSWKQAGLPVSCRPENS